MFRKVLVSLLLCLAAPLAAQSYEPAVSFYSFLQMKPQLNTAEPSIADNVLDLVFAPPGDFEAQIIYRNGDQIIDQLTAKPSQRFGTMARMKWKRTTVNLGTNPGPRSVEVMLNGKSVGLLEFTLNKSGGNDPFNPTPTWTVDGPWGNHAYFTYPADDSGQQRINFHYWSKRSDLGGAKGMIDVAIKRGNKVLAKTRSSEASYDFYLHRDLPLLKPDGQPVMIPDLKAMEGPIVVEMSHEGKVVKRFRGSIAGGQFKPHAQSALDYQPRNGFLSPRTVSQGGGEIDSRILVWLTAE